MSHERHQRIARIFAQAVSLQGEARERHVEEACGGDHSLKGEIEDLLARDAVAGDVLPESGAPEALIRSLLSSHAGDPAVPARIGLFRIRRVVGAGGMGTVYEAEQSHPDRVVALKLLNVHGAGLAAHERFLREIRILGRLHHPGIAQIYEAGSSDLGRGPQPYFTMELIRGRSLLAECRERSIEERLRLFALVCDAMAYAHAQGVVHRDLKPSNILVDEHGQPKVLDFGVARDLIGGVEGATVHTSAGQLMGTLPYMSPEQLDGEAGTVDVRSDVYALGVIFYEVLAKKPPYEVRYCELPAAVRIIREEEPSRLSCVDTVFRGDIETIVAKAMAKEPDRRYASAQELASDIRRHLDRQPIAARPASSMYYLAKFGKRHPGLVGGVVATLAALLLGIVVVSVQLSRARLAERAAETERVHVQSINRVLLELLAATAAADGSTRRDASAAELLASLSGSLSNQLRDSPESELEIRRSIGQACLNMGLEQLAVDNYERAASLAMSLFGSQSETTLRLQERQAFAIGCQLRWTWSRELARDAVQWLEPALRSAKANMGPEHPTTHSLQYSLAQCLNTSDAPEKAMPLLEALCSSLRSMKAEQRPVSFAGALTMYASTVAQRGDAAGSERVFAEAERVLLADSGITPVELEFGGPSLLAMSFQHRRLMHRAEAVFSAALHVLRTQNGDSYSETIRIKDHLALLFMSEGKFQEASRLWIERFEVASGRGRVASDNAAWLAGRSGMAFGAMGKIAECVEWYDRAISLQRTAHGDADRLAIEYWVHRELWKGLGARSEWKSQPLYWACRRIIMERLYGEAEPYGPDGLDWASTRLSILKHESALDGEVNDATLERKTIDELKQLVDPSPGLYRLALCPSGGPVSPGSMDAVWVLMAPIEMQLYGRPDSVRLDRVWWSDAFSGTPLETRCTNALALDGWWDRGFGPFGTEYTFSARGGGAITVPVGDYRLCVRADDGVKVWIDDCLLVDRWEVGRIADSGSRWRSTGGSHELRFEYFQHGGASSLWVWLEPIAIESQSGGAWVLSEMGLVCVRTNTVPRQRWRRIRVPSGAGVEKTPCRMSGIPARIEPPRRHVGRGTPSMDHGNASALFSAFGSWRGTPRSGL